MATAFGFELLKLDGRARRGRLVTPHGEIDTPAFMPVGTRAALKGLSPLQVRGTGTQVVLANTYHLLLRPGAEVVAHFGGVQRFMNWHGPVLTDSGGFQVFSLADLRRLDDDGVVFRSHIDGAKVTLTPEISIAVQNQLGADIIMCFDECPSLVGASGNAGKWECGNEPTDAGSAPHLPTIPPSHLPTIVDAVRRTVAWAKRCKAAHARQDQALYGIVQGGLDVGLRRTCLDQLVEIGFDGYALGGLSVGEPPAAMREFLDAFAHELPADRPRYLMGVGTPADLIHAVSAGIDQFDCVLPTRNGRKGYAFTSRGVLRMKNAHHRLSDEPLDAACGCETCRGFSRGYLRHLFMNEEVLGATLVSLHNVAFYQDLMRRLREAIATGRLETLKAELLAGPIAGRRDEETE
ncbi:MAG: tRNA guanosine(34) transglycosylase Tgt [Planctomycetes bacterium]|nr:tRNA guanosine(34) transglycosylase Tgt [Planctomycetota bacterium]